MPNTANHMTAFVHVREPANMTTVAIHDLSDKAMAWLIAQINGVTLQQPQADQQYLYGSHTGLPYCPFLDARISLPMIEERGISITKTSEGWTASRGDRYNSYSGTTLLRAGLRAVIDADYSSIACVPAITIT